MEQTDALDEVYDRLHGTGPEFQGWLSNHGPMAADALIRLGHGDGVMTWVDRYANRLEPEPCARWAIAEADWRDPLGDASRLGDWCVLMGRQVKAAPWEEVLARWWPRLLPGAVASATHGLIRTGHAVRALREEVTDARLGELGRALAYWAARWQPLPDPLPAPSLPVRSAFDALPAGEDEGGFRARLAHLAADSDWRRALGAVPPRTDPVRIPGRIDELVDLAVAGYARWGHGDPVMMVHAATAPRAVGLVLPALPERLWLPSYDAAWRVTAVVAAAYRPAEPCRASGWMNSDDVDDVVDRAVASADEHAIKLTEVAVESFHRGSPAALDAAWKAVQMIAAD